MFSKRVSLFKLRDCLRKNLSYLSHYKAKKLENFSMKICSSESGSRQIILRVSVVICTRHSDQCLHPLLHLPTQICFPIGGKRVTCHGSTLTNPLEDTNLNFRLTRDQVVHFETMSNVRSAGVKTINFWQS